MSIAKTTEDKARQIILSQCRQFVEDTPYDEPGIDWEVRVIDLAKYLSHQTGADIDSKATRELEELITTLEELESVDAGTHPDIRTNRHLTIDNRPELRDNLNGVLRDNMWELLSVAGFKAKKAAA